MRWIFLLLISLNVWGVGFLQPAEAFKPKISLIDDNTVGVEIELGKNIYVYKDKLKVEDANLNDGIDFASVSMAEAIDHEGEKVFENSPAIRIKLTKSADLIGPQTIGVKLSYQGCSSAGLCYEPMETALTIPVNADKLISGDTVSSPLLKAPAAKSVSAEAVA
ncbi:protein-disulfide reductase DsbD N-terminal domain-containing protein, partial [Sulfuricurvum sp.]|uniref:protein-disulfide reductase DsbD N-terminal domain-containing protein n=1 Tax=Sulfuricurvum sp. TaxID=2025608 RepID=UPI003BB1D011